MYLQWSLNSTDLKTAYCVMIQCISCRSNQEVAKMCSEMNPVAEQTKINIQNVKKDVGK